MKIGRIAAAVLACAMSIGTARFPAIAAAQVPAVTFNSISPAVNGGEPIRGVDISSVLSVEKAGVVFRNSSGEPADIFEVLASHGVNYIRVRVWNQPDDGKGHSYGGGNNDVRAAAEIGRRAAACGMKILVDFHYSDFWADPEKQRPPKAWLGMSVADKGSAIYQFTLESLKTIREAGADIGMVQIGNETNSVFCGEDDMYRICEMFKAGCNAVHDFDADVLRVLHFANPSTGYYDWYAKVLAECNVDYDVFATSYYPYWHGTAENMTDVMKKIAQTYDKYVMVAETAYPYTNEDGDSFGNVVSKDSSGVVFRYEISPEGQAACLTSVFQAMANVGEKGLGVFYWEPAWLGKQGISWQEQRKLWEEQGSGWATSYAREYDASVDDAGGSSYDNQALFSFDGTPLPALDVFSTIYPQTYHYQAEDSVALANGYYTIRNEGSGLFLNSDNSGNVIQSKQEMQWHLAATNDGYMISDAAGNYLTVGSQGSTTQSAVHLSSRSLPKEQTFQTAKCTNGTMLMTLNSGLTQCLDVFDASTYEGAWITYNKPLKTASQCFVLTLVKEDVPETEPETAHVVTKGDIVEDQVIDLTDILLLQKYLLCCADMTAEQCDAADLNIDDTVDVFDLGMLKRIVLEDGH
ncbi:MAG: glycosyl hydrolase 53 family protein [Oscillospiraceae bacterium]|nr:glycosyl hydrolase 53 family protein [Oscillospiraceae bacterium]